MVTASVREGLDVWWEPVTDDERALGDRLAALTAQFQGHLRDVAEGLTPQAVWGVGSAPGPDGAWDRELVLVDAGGLGDSDLPLGRYEARELFSRLQRLRLPPALAVLLPWELSPIALIDVTSRPLSAAAVCTGNLVEEVATRTKNATVGLPCTFTATGATGFITAGHLVTGPGDVVEVLASGPDSTGNASPTWLPGRVAHWSDPAVVGTPGYDYAVVELFGQGQILRLGHAGVVAPPTSPYSPIDAEVYGAVSGGGIGQVSGALNQLGDARRQWLDCWQIAPSHLLTLGDSGSLVLGRGGPNHQKILGHFVGGSFWPTPPGMIHQYVQDFDSCLKSGLENHISI